MHSFISYFQNPFKAVFGLIKIFNFLFPDKLYVEMLFRFRMGKRLDLKTPKTYNEKLQWLKLYDRKSCYAILVDKYAVKEIVAKQIGKEHVIPTLGVWQQPEDIDWGSLPSKFVLKTTMGGGNNGVIVCKDITKLNKQQAVAKLRKSMKDDIYKRLREWPYKDVPKRVIAEVYMEDVESGELPDYKFFCFDGEVKALFIATERGTGNVKFDFFDKDFNHLDLVQSHPMSGKEIEKPNCYDEMIRIAETLSKGIPHVRIDLYEVNGKVYFGEYTFYHHGGIMPFHPEKWDYEFGSWIKLPSKS